MGHTEAVRRGAQRLVRVERWLQAAPSVDPTAYQLLIDMAYTASGNDYVDYKPGSSLSVTVPSGTLKPDQSGVGLCITATNRTTDLGSHAEAGSYCLVANGDLVYINTAP